MSRAACDASASSMGGGAALSSTEVGLPMFAVKAKRRNNGKRIGRAQAGRLHDFPQLVKQSEKSLEDEGDSSLAV